jgi:Mrp family chromosome partitioning ATPase
MLGLGRKPGLSEYLQGERSLTASIYRIDGQRLWVFPSGRAPSDALELLQVGKVSTLMDHVTRLFDWIIIDSPPALPLADTSVWMRLADGILLLVRQGVTEKRQLLRGLEALESTKLLGAIVNSSKHSSDGYYYYRSADLSQPTDSPNHAD